MDTSDVTATFEKYVIGNYNRLPLVIVKGEGSHVWDSDGRQYIDLFPGWGVSGLGHCHPRVVEAIRSQVGRLIHVANNYYSEPQGLLARAISEHSFGGKCFFCNSGAEAVEAAIKLSRIHSAPGRYKFVTFEGSFHGRTLAAVTATAQPKYHQGFEPMPPGFSYARFNDIASVEEVVDDQTCAILLEVIQGEGGINVAEERFLKDLRRLCDERELLLVFDEVQSGMGRTGEYFAYQLFGVEPDIMTLAKSLGGGVAIGAMVAGSEVAESLKPGTHASTFGGNALACAAGLAVFEAIDEEDLLAHTRQMGEYAFERLEKMRSKFPFIREVRGKGLMIGVDLARDGVDLFSRCLRKGLLINCTQGHVLRIMPAMTVPPDVLASGLDVLEEVLAETVSSSE